MLSAIIKLSYNWSIQLFYLGARISSLWNIKAQIWIDERKEAFKILEQHRHENPSNKRIWMHCASSGEFQQGRPLIKSLKSQHPNLSIYVSFFSPSGYKVWHKDSVIDVAFYLPLDTRNNATKLIELINPDLVLIVKNEFWFNLIDTLFSKKIPVIYHSVIIHKGHHIFLPYFKSIIAQVNHFFVQDMKSKDRLTSSGIDDVTVAGDMRIDYILSQRNILETPNILLEMRKGFRQCIVYGSVWAKDIKILHKYILSSEEMLHLIVPHEVDEKSIKGISRLLPNGQRLSNLIEPSSANVIIIDEMGVLKLLYGLADLAYIGGGFGKGIHNILEPAIHQIPVIFGPNHQKFKEAIELLALQAAMAINDTHDISTTFDTQLKNKGAIRIKLSEYFESNKGATQIVVNKLKEFGHV